MAYTYVSARALKAQVAAKWEPVDLAGEYVFRIFQDYRKVYLELDTGEGHVIVDFWQLQGEYAGYGNTLNLLLQVLGNRTLETVDEWPDSRIDQIIYSDAYLAGYHLSYASAGRQYPENYPVDENPDLSIVRSDTLADQIHYVHTHCLVSVNGFLHNTVMMNGEVYVAAGGMTARKAVHPSLGVLSFYSLGELEKIEITEGMIEGSEGQPLAERIRLTVPEGEGTWMLVLGGYLVMPDDLAFWVSGDTQVTLDLQKLPYVERLFESGRTMDLSSLQLVLPYENPDLIDLEDAWSDAVIKRYLTLPQSFLVRVDRKNMFWQRGGIRPTGTPGTYIQVDEPTLPLFLGYGKLGDYWKIQEGDRWAMTVRDAEYRDYIFSREPQNQLQYVSNTLASDSFRRFVEATYLEIGAYGAHD